MCFEESIGIESSAGNEKLRSVLHQRITANGGNKRDRSEITLLIKQCDAHCIWMCLKLRTKQRFHNVLRKVIQQQSFDDKI
mmetsp:Transcript_21197/g.28209  ORF Transcript_21197/g.28209 Transcript_21197/m.28209 type:complete len:81 (+) Transcript_21197:690-932(+)